MASQRNTGGSGRWQVKNGELYISSRGGQLEFVRTILKKNSNGYPVIVGDGVEYTRCR